MALNHSWLIILFSGFTAFLFRILPFFIKDSTLLNNQNGRFYRFLSYSTQAMLGVIIYESTFKKQNFVDALQSLDVLGFLRLALLIVLFLWVCRSKKILGSFFTCLLVYFVALIVFKS